MARRRFELRPPWNLAAAALLFVALDALVFKSGLYQRVASPTSVNGGLAFFVRHERARARAPGVEDALVIGDSGIGEAVLPAAAEAAHPEATLRLIKAGLPDLSLRGAYYVLRAIDPSRARYRMVVVPLHYYLASTDDDTLADDDRDLEMLAPFARAGDYFEFARSLRGLAARTRALAYGSLGCVRYADDFRDLLRDPQARLADVAAYERVGDRLAYTYQGKAESLVGLSWDPRTRALHIPESVPVERRAYLAEHYRPRFSGDLHKVQESAAYQRAWLGRIVDYYRGSATTIVVLQMPTGPTPLPNIDPPDGAPSVVAQLAREPGVVVLDADAFMFLRDPRYFYGVRHLNAAGGRAFSTTLLERLERLRVAREGERR